MGGLAPGAESESGRLCQGPAATRRRSGLVLTILRSPARGRGSTAGNALLSRIGPAPEFMLTAQDNRSPRQTPVECCSSLWA